MRNEAFEGLIKERKRSELLCLSDELIERIARNKAGAIEKRKRFRERKARNVENTELTKAEIETCKRNKGRALEIRRSKAFIAELLHHFD